MERRAHWEKVYATKGEDEVSWFQAHPTVSLELIRATGMPKDAAIIDIGGGASRLVDVLLQEGYLSLAVLDLSEQALAKAKARLGERGDAVRWITADATTWTPTATFDVWHDRAAFHFLTKPEHQAAYVARLLRALRNNGHVIFGTFAMDGPEQCSGLPVERHDAASLGQALGSAFELVTTFRHVHVSPMGRPQAFQFSHFRRVL